jgi:glycine/D-amino acid oxidase-like deaminating enzyme
MIETDTLIIGAGLAGLTAARHLRDNGRNVVRDRKIADHRADGCRPGAAITAVSITAPSISPAAHLSFTRMVNQLAENRRRRPMATKGKDSTMALVGRPARHVGPGQGTGRQDLDIRFRDAGDGDQNHGGTASSLLKRQTNPDTDLGIKDHWQPFRHRKQLLWSRLILHSPNRAGADGPLLGGNGCLRYPFERVSGHTPRRIRRSTGADCPQQLQAWTQWRNLCSSRLTRMEP